MRIFMTGGTGFVGTALTRLLIREGHEVTLLSRAARDAPGPTQGIRYLEGNPSLRGDWQGKVEGHDVVINLAGASIFTRWTREAKTRIRESRIHTTRNLVEALTARRGMETLFLSASAVGYYGFHGDEELDEESPPGEGFLAAVTQEWEDAAMEAQAASLRVVLLRFGVVLGREGGALKKMVLPFRYCLGSPLGTGNQWFSWIHEQDLARIFLFVMGRNDLSGPINCTAPNPVRNREWTRALGEALGRPAFLPAVPSFVIRAALGEFGSLMIEGQRVIPRRISGAGFSFDFPDVQVTLRDLL